MADNRRREPPKKMLSVEVEEPHPLENGSYSITASAVATQGKRALEGERIQFFLGAVDYEQPIITDQNGRAMMEFIITPQTDKTFIQAQIVGEAAKSNPRGVNFPKKQSQPEAKDFFVDVDRMEGKSISFFCRVTDQNGIGAKGHRLTIVENGKITHGETDDCGEYLHKKELSKEERYEIAIIGCGFVEKFHRIFHGRGIHFPEEKKEGEKNSIKKIEEGASRGKIGRFFYWFIDPVRNNKILLILFLVFLATLIWALFFGRGEPLGFQALVQMGSEPIKLNEIERYYYSSVPHLAPEALTQAKFEPPKEYSWRIFMDQNAWIAVLVSFLLFLIYTPFASWDEVKNSWHAAWDKFEERPFATARVSRTEEELKGPAPKLPFVPLTAWQRFKERIVATFSGDMLWDFAQGFIRRKIKAKVLSKF